MSQLFTGDFSQAPQVPKIADVQPFGVNVLVELLTPQECLGTSLTVDNVELDVHQAYVLGIGPRVPKDHGVAVGQRVYIHGAINFCPNFGIYEFSHTGRKRGTLDYNMIKGVCIEETTDASS